MKIDITGIWIVGAGGVGGTLATVLHDSKNQVRLIARGAHLKAIQKDGLRVSTQNMKAYRIPAQSNFENMDSDLVILAMKCADLDRTAQTLSKFISNNTPIITLQNGIESEEIVGRHIPMKQIVAGIAYVDAKIDAPGVISIASPPRLTLGENLPSVTEIFEKAGIPVTISEDVRIAKWKKLAWNSVFNSLCVVARTTVGGVRENPALVLLGRELIRETLAVASKEGVPLPADLADRIFGETKGLGSGNLESRTSMWADFEAGKLTEVDYLNGAISRRGKFHSVPTPLHDTIVALVHALEKSR